MYIHILESNYIHTNIFGTYTCIHVNLSMQLQCVCVAVCCRIPCVRLAGNGNYNMCCMATTICVAVRNSMLLQCVTRGARAEVSRNVFLHTQTYASDSPRMATVMCVAVFVAVFVAVCRGRRACCSVLQYVVTCPDMRVGPAYNEHCDACCSACCSVCCSVFQHMCVAVCCSILLHTVTYA